MSSSKERRFSFGGKLTDLVNVAVWKFDVELRDHTLVTAYVSHASREDAFKALFVACVGAKVYGTGMPLTKKAAEDEAGRPLRPAEVMLVKMGAS